MLALLFVRCTMLAFTYALFSLNGTLVCFIPMAQFVKAGENTERISQRSNPSLIPVGFRMDPKCDLIAGRNSVSAV